MVVLVGYYISLYVSYKQACSFTSSLSIVQFNSTRWSLIHNMR